MYAAPPTGEVPDVLGCANNPLLTRVHCRSYFHLCLAKVRSHPCDFHCSVCVCVCVGISVSWDMGSSLRPSLAQHTDLVLNSPSQLIWWWGGVCSTLEAC